MSVKIIYPQEFFKAYITLKRSIISMSQLVLSQIRFAAKCLGTDVTFVRPFLKRVRRFAMSTKLVHVDKSLIADSTRKGSYVVVQQSLVVLIRVVSCKTLVADVAFVWSLASVDAHVDREAVVIAE